MEFIVSVGLFILGFVFGMAWFSTTILPIFYGLPKSVWWVIRGRLKWHTPLRYLAAPIIFNFVATGIFYALITWAPKVAVTIAGSAAFNFATIISSGFGLLMAIFSQSTRDSIRKDFEDFVSSGGKEVRVNGIFD